MLQKILYATDLGLFGPVVLEHVCELAKKYQATVSVVHAVEPVGIFADALLEAYVPHKEKTALKLHGYDAVMTTIRARVKQAFEDEFIDLTGSRDWVDSVEVIEGDPASIILESAERCQADVIVMGTHGGGDSKNSTAIGSVASKVLQLSRIPIYLVPTTQGFRQYSRHMQY